MTIRTCILNADHTLLDGVKALHRASRDTLGFLPWGAFLEYASRDLILGATDGDELVGYLLYRPRSRIGSVSITHLCVSISSRGRGVGRLLVDRLALVESAATHIELWCRSDFDANAMWPRLGFVARGEKQGRGGVLVNWRRQCSYSAQGELPFQPDSPVDSSVAAIDADVFFDLADEMRGDLDMPDSAALLADWLESEVSICVTVELANEIARSATRERRSSSTKFREGFRELPMDERRFEEAHGRVAKILVGAAHESDCRQLARASSGGADVFITRDRNLLNKSSQFSDELELLVLSPAELIGRLDEIRREKEYRPRRVKGSAIRVTRVGGQDLAAVLSSFLQYGEGEKKHQLRTALETLLIGPETSQVEMIDEQTTGPLALIGYQVSSSDPGCTLHVSVVRLTASEARLRETLLREVCARILEAAVFNECAGIEIADDFLAQGFAEPLSEFGFRKKEGRWIRLAIDRVVRAIEYREAAQAESLSPAFLELANEVSSVVESAKGSGGLRAMSSAERQVWPGKISDFDLPCVVIPIRPYWAMQLFDEELANMDLLGSDARLAINNENIYYSTYRGRQLKFPGRILWYVSNSDQEPLSGAIRACSILEEVEVGSAQDLFGRNQRFGAYDWRDLMNLVDGKPDAEMLTVRFSFAQSFRHPVKFVDVQEVLMSCEGRRNQFMSITGVSTATYLSLYKKGME